MCYIASVDVTRVTRRIRMKSPVGVEKEVGLPDLCG